ncbi:glutamyl-tRNA(Gln) amidotransferase subunit A [Mycolicibacterium mageritense DSM 44476 = CIP 104973]|uniref:amidase n=1 Tax=Mycolicibacterium mageritense TaxID=53462 RepID=A0AAI8XNZ0_MYCME|nr:amidase [Mycolicibacterium mageritense]BBX34419.1 glutamyl-tRNA amidotransferase subunit A [Mycolicibacterium mageritense]BDY29397.1 Acylamidase [Mycolicibacterium mageritense]CDO21062.1 glutamyl-tRNA(Gln) amidotransferase subunit A [Mycolicibacterium mageritense DSM 44476 = CIP 104973]
MGTGVMTPPAYLSATEAVKAFRRLELSPLEVLEAQIEQIETHNGDTATGINALTETLFDDARTLARRAADAYARCAATGQEPPPLLGVTVATKEKHGIAGLRLEQGLAAHRGRIAEQDHPVVERIRAAGGIIHARTTSPEFSCATVTHSPMWGVTRNPWNRRTSPGGSSGGAGAALAAGFTTLATASDIAGSTRIPAGFTGTVGYKAPYGRIPGLPPLAADWYRGDGPMGRTVADVALLSSVLAGRHPADHASWGAHGALPSLDGGVQGLRIGLSVRLGDYPVADAVAANTDAVAIALQQAGAELVDVELPWTTALVRDTIFAHFGHILGPAMARETTGTERELAAYTRQFILDAAVAAQRYSLLDSLAMDARMRADLATAMRDTDVLLCPTSAVTSLQADGEYLDGIDTPSGHREHYWEGHLTSPFNVANHCAVLSVPSGLSDDNVPTGVQVVSHPHDEAMAFRVAHAVEALVGFDARPSLQHC